jgi:hypothetical protein
MRTATTPARAREELVARQALSMREMLLCVHRRQARREDLEDLYSQAVLELLARARRDPTLRERAHVANALRQKLAARLLDHRRATHGRSRAETARACVLDIGLFAHRLAGSEDTAQSVIHREQLRAILDASQVLSDDQRHALASRIAGESRARCCARQGWSEAKYHKLIQRGGARLRAQLQGS